MSFLSSTSMILYVKIVKASSVKPKEQNLYYFAQEFVFVKVFSNLLVDHSLKSLLNIGKISWGQERINRVPTSYLDIPVLYHLYTLRNCILLLGVGTHHHKKNLLTIKRDILASPESIYIFFMLLMSVWNSYVPGIILLLLPVKILEKLPSYWLSVLSFWSWQSFHV